jgi:dual specificity tyrosine-phosphorylation-regulated kinase 2/3/4
VRILEHLRACDPGDEGNFVHMHERFTFRSHVCIAFELLSMSLYDFAKANNYQGMQLGLIRHFAQQLLVSLRVMRANRVLHCDLKPENILLRAPNKPGIRLIDFGSSLLEDEHTPSSLPSYIQSRYYRAPEVILGLAYDGGIDMWSLACVLAELFLGRPLFQGQTEMEQLACIMEALGLPPRNLLEQASRRTHFFDSSGAPRPEANSRVKRKPGSRTLATALRCPDAGFVAFLQGCLRWDPRERLSPDAALAHSWICQAAPPPPAAKSSPVRGRDVIFNINAKVRGM